MKTKTIVCGGLAVLATFIYGASRHAPEERSAAYIPGANSAAQRIAPDFELKTLAGRKVKLSDFRGKVVVLNFWATYCGPCRVEMPWLVDLSKQYRSRGLEVIGVSMDDEGEQKQVTDFVREIGVPYPILLGNHTVGDAYGGAHLLPQTFFIDRDGTIAESAIGMKTKKEFDRIVRELLAKGDRT